MQKIPLKTKYHSTFPDLKTDFWNRNSRIVKGILLIFSDLFCLGLSLGVAFFLRFIVQGEKIPAAYLNLIPYMGHCFGDFRNIRIVFKRNVSCAGTETSDDCHHRSVSDSGGFLLFLA